MEGTSPPGRPQSPGPDVASLELTVSKQLANPAPRRVSGTVAEAPDPGSDEKPPGCSLWLRIASLLTPLDTSNDHFLVILDRKSSDSMAR